MPEFNQNTPRASHERDTSIQASTEVNCIVDDEKTQSFLEIKRYALALINNNNLDEASDVLQKGIQQYPYSTALHNNLGQLYALKGEFESAFFHLRLVTKLDDSIEVAWIGAIKCCIELARFTDVSLLTEQAARAGVSVEKLAPFRMAVLNNIGMHSLAIDISDCYPGRIYECEDTAVQLIDALLSVGCWSKSQKAASNCIAKGMKDRRLQIQLSVAYRELGQFEKAHEVIKTVVEQYPADINALKAYSAVLQDEGKNLQATKLVKSYIKYDKAYGSKKLFDIYCALGDWHSANRYHSDRWGLTTNKNKANRKILPLWNADVRHPSIVYVYREQGLGDQILAYRLLQIMCASHDNAPKFVIELDRRLVDLLPATANIVPVTERISPLDSRLDLLFSHHISMADLCWSFTQDSRLQELLSSSDIHHYCSQQTRNYILSKDCAGQALGKCKADYSLGIAWRSDGIQGPAQSIELSTLLGVLSNHGWSEIVSLQYLPTIVERRTASVLGNYLEFPNIDIYSNLHNLASLILKCEHVICCSQVACHMAGLLGTKTELLLSPSRAKNWHWCLANNNGFSKIYNTIRIHERASRFSDWAPVIGAAATSITERIQFTR